jgi:hypothetical protein
LILLFEDPTTQEELRAEMIDVLHTCGWKKAALYNLKLLDSVLKES